MRICLILCCWLSVLCCSSQPSGLSPKRAQVIAVAAKEVGTKEASYNAGPRVNQYLAASGNRPGEYWCSAFVTWVYKFCAIKTPPGAGAARSYFQPGPKLLFQRGKSGNIELGQPGDAVGFYYPNLGRIGHIALIEKTADNCFFTIEGNTGADGGRNGDGVWRKRRMKRSIYAVANHIGI